MLKRRSPKDIIEGVEHPENESVFIKYPREEPVEVTKSGVSTWDSTEADESKVLFYLKKHGGERYTHIHTHPNQRYSILPSNNDFANFLVNDKIKNMVIAIKDEDTNKILGYNIFSKTEKTPRLSEEELTEKSKTSSFTDKIAKTFDKLFNNSYNETIELTELAKRRLKETKYLLKKENLISMVLNVSDTFYPLDVHYVKYKYHLKEKSVVAPEYEIEDIFRYKIQKKSGIEEKVIATSFLMIISGFFFLSQNITGNVIANLNQTSANFIGIILFLLGISGVFYYNKKRRKKCQKKK